jgi:DNA repair exonuclease SbcCD ATPase subunit
LEQRLASLLEEKEKNDMYLQDLEQKYESLAMERSGTTEKLLLMKSELSDLQIHLDQKQHEYMNLKFQNESLYQELEDVKADLAHTKDSSHDYHGLYEKSLKEIADLQSRIHHLELSLKEKSELIVSIQTLTCHTQTEVPAILDFETQTESLVQLSQSNKVEVVIEPVVMRHFGTQTIDSAPELPDYTDLRALDISGVSISNSMMTPHLHEDLERSEEAAKELALVVEKLERENVHVVHLGLVEAKDYGLSIIYNGCTTRTHVTKSLR